MPLFSHFAPISMVYAPLPMPEIRVQVLDEPYVEGYYTVRSLTYNDGNPIPPERRLYDAPGRFGIVGVLDGEVCGVATILEMTATRGAATLKCGAVAGVAVLPEKRNTGVGSAMMSWLVRHFGESGIPLASLYPFREPYYRRFGYEVAGRRVKIVCPTHRLPKVTTTLPLRRLKPSDWELLVDCYTAFARTRSGVNIRNDWQWQRVLGENRELTIYAVGDPVEAYAVVSHQTSFWTTDHISEIAWGTRRGYDGLMSVFAGIAINKAGLSWFEPSDGPFVWNYLDAGVELKTERHVMYRGNDVPGALSQLRPNPSLRGEFVLGIEDRVVPENGGPWQVIFENGEVSVEKARSNIQVDLTLGAGHFAQAFLGEPDLTTLASLGNVRVDSPRALPVAQSLLPAQATYLMDFF